MRTRSVGLAGLRGWRTSVADAAATPIAKRSKLSEDQVRSIIGGIFLVLALTYVVGALNDLVRGGE